jgi:hypothetical protein
MRLSNALLAVGIALLGSGASSAYAQSQFDPWGKPADLKPMLPIIPPLLPPNSTITSGPASGSQVQTPLFDPTRDQATPGLRLTIPTR